MKVSNLVSSGQVNILELEKLIDSHETLTLAITKDRTLITTHYGDRFLVSNRDSVFKGLVQKLKELERRECMLRYKILAPYDTGVNAIIDRIDDIIETGRKYIQSNQEFDEANRLLTKENEYHKKSIKFVGSFWYKVWKFFN